jgi:predicted RNase H-like HicB family nuclease
MTRQFTASLVKEGEWVVAQCLEVDVASQGKTEEEALASLGEAMELFFSDPHSDVQPRIIPFSVEIDAA